MLVINIPIQDPKNPPSVKFAALCVHCGQPTADVLPLAIPMGVQKRSEPVIMKLPVPLCAEGAKLERGLAKVTLIPFLIGGLLIGIPAFFLAWLLTPENFISSTSRAAVFADLILGAFAGLMAGLIGGSLIEMAFKLLFAPAYGKLLLKRPLTVLEILNDTETCVGFTAALSKDKKQLQLTFEHEQVGREFQQLNNRQE
jgi:hypothetical protein